jgi:hypothetical protein
VKEYWKIPIKKPEHYMYYDRVTNEYLNHEDVLEAVDEGLTLEVLNCDLECLEINIEDKISDFFTEGEPHYLDEINKHIDAINDLLKSEPMYIPSDTRPPEDWFEEEKNELG